MELTVSEDVAAAATAAFVRISPRVVALAGGSTPRPFYERLATAYLGYPWEEIEVLFTDERCVPPDDPASNFRMAHEALLSRLQPKGPRIHRIEGERCVAEDYEKELATLSIGDRKIDLVVLGLGEDGHTASLFPDDRALEEPERLVVRVERADHPRLTLTLPALSSAAVALFLVAGQSKRSVLRGFLNGRDMPAARVRAGRVLVIADHAAAG